MGRRRIYFNKAINPQTPFVLQKRRCQCLGASLIVIVEIYFF